MRTRTPWLLLMLASLVLGAVGSLVAVAATPGSAAACSIAGPYGEVWPSSDLQPGQQIDIVGWSFIDVRVHEPQPALVAPPDSDRAVPPELCDFDIFPLESVRIIWHGASANGEVTETLGVVSGPDFTLTAVVPQSAAAGPATIIMGPVTLNVLVGSIVQPPPPCPLVADGAGASSHSCPEPWPCPLTTQPAPGHTPGLFPPCPEPCVDYAHTIDDGTEYHYQWDCPDPCGYEVSPGAAPNEAAVWCPPPPPEPCPVYNAATPGAVNEALPWCPDPCSVIGADAVWCPPPPPEPCPLYSADDRLVSPEECPDPCSVIGGDAVWCPPPPPEPCPLYNATAPDGAGEAIAWCPDPCPVYFGSDATVAPEHLVACPDPCAVIGGDAVWCPPPCFDNTAVVASDCPIPVPAHEASESDRSTAGVSVPAPPPVAATHSAASGLPAQPAISFDGFVTATNPAMSEGARAASAAAAVARDIMAIAWGMRTNLFG